MSRGCAPHKQWINSSLQSVCVCSHRFCSYSVVPFSCGVLFFTRAAGRRHVYGCAWFCADNALVGRCHTLIAVLWRRRELIAVIIMCRRSAHVICVSSEVIASTSTHSVSVDACRPSAECCSLLLLLWLILLGGKFIMYICLHVSWYGAVGRSNIIPQTFWLKPIFIAC